MKLSASTLAIKVSICGSFTSFPIGIMSVVETFSCPVLLLNDLHAQLANNKRNGADDMNQVKILAQKIVFWEN